MSLIPYHISRKSLEKIKGEHQVPQIKYNVTNNKQGHNHNIYNNNNNNINRKIISFRSLGLTFIDHNLLCDIFQIWHKMVEIC